MVGIGSIWLRIGTDGGLMWMRWWISGFHKMLGSSRVAAQLAASRVGLGSMSEWVREWELCSGIYSIVTTRLPKNRLRKYGIPREGKFDGMSERLQTVKAQWKLYPSTASTCINPVFCSRTVFMWFIWFSEYTSLHISNWFLFIIVTPCVFCWVGTEYLNIIYNWFLNIIAINSVLQ
jgi:hypothetical protein